MNTTSTATPNNVDVVSAEPARRGALSTADLAAAASPAAASPATPGAAAPTELTHDGGAELAQLFPPETAGAHRRRWDAIQIGFVDDPGRAVREADELVAEVMQGLADSFAKARSGFEAELGQDGQASTEHMRVTLQRYRSFFQRLLSL